MSITAQTLTARLESLYQMAESVEGRFYTDDDGAEFAEIAAMSRTAEATTAALRAQNAMLREALAYMVEQANMGQPRDLRAGSGYHKARAALAASVQS